MSALLGALGYLRCPHCATPLALAGAVVGCRRGHSFDIARQGYLSLRTGAATVPGDAAAMVAARERFLSRGHFRPLARALAARAERASPPGSGGCVVDLGAGTGWYLAHVLERLPERVGIALDASRYALRRAARAHARAAAVGCDVWAGLPLATGAASLVINVFAPRNAAGVARVLQPGGVLLVAVPTARHLGEVVGALDLLDVDARKRERLDRALGGHLVAVGEETHEHTMALSHDDLLALVQMGPSAYHHAGDDLASRIERLDDPVAVTASVRIATYRCPTGS